MTLEDLKNSIGENKIGEVLEFLKTKFEAGNAELYHDVLLLSASYKDLNRQLIQGIVENNTEMNRIRSALLKLIDEGAASLKPELKPAFAEVPTNNLETIRQIFQIEEAAGQAILYQLIFTDYKWRTLETLEKRTGLDAEKIETFARAHPEFIIRSKSKSGKIIFKLTPTAGDKVKSF